MPRKPKPSSYTARCPGKANKGKPRKARRAVPRKPKLRALVLRFLDAIAAGQASTDGWSDEANDALDALREAVTK